MNNMSGVCVCFPLPCFAAEHALSVPFFLFFFNASGSMWLSPFGGYIPPNLTSMPCSQ